ncbi:MAG: LysE family translocator [Gammaproteobacteria bacterium]|nr:LysE family translocator [Gammaproteobacteria bacterium]
MTDLLPSTPLLTTFLLASLVLAVTPGPGVLYIVAASVSRGRANGLASVAGVALGNLVNAIGAAVGLAALFAVSAASFTLVKYAGAAYLIYLGVRALRASSTTPDASGEALPSRRRAFREGLVVAVLNPKTTLFYAAFLPQFMNPVGSPLIQGVLLGVLFVVVAAVTDSIYALVAGSIADRLRDTRRVRNAGRRVTGITYIALGLFAAASDPPRATLPRG